MINSKLNYRLVSHPKKVIDSLTLPFVGFSFHFHLKITLRLQDLYSRALADFTKTKRDTSLFN